MSAAEPPLRSLPCLVLLALLFLLPAWQVRAAGTLGVTWHIDGGFDGHYRPGAWVPLRVRVANSGPTFNGTLRVDDSGQQGLAVAVPTKRVDYVRHIVMPENGTKQFTLYVPGADLGSAVTVELTSDDGGLALQQQVSLSPLNAGTLLVGVLSHSSALLQQMRAMPTVADAARTLVNLTADTVDVQPLALNSLDLVIVGDYPTNELSDEQGATLETWVRAGGTLIEIGGPTAQATVSGLPAALRLVQPAQPLTLRALPGVARLGNGSFPSGQSIVAAGRILAGVSLLNLDTSLGTTPLVVEQPLGLGSVVYSALDPTIGPLAVSRALPAYWSLLAATAQTAAATNTAQLLGTQQISGVGSTLGGEIDNVSPPSITLFVILLGAYVLLLVPLNFIVLGRIRRRDWSWVSLPMLAVIFVAATFATAYFGRARNVRTSVVSVVYLTSGSPRVATQSYLGLFSPVAGDYTVDADDPGMLGTALFQSTQGGGIGGGTSTVGLEFSQDRGQALLPGMSMWDSRNLVLAGITTYHGALDGTLRIGADGHITGTLVNRTGVPLVSVVLAPYGGAFQALNDIPAGGTVQVDMTSGSSSGPSQTSIDQFYGNSAALVRHASSRNIALAGNEHLLASIGLDLPGALNAAGPLRRLADDTIRTNPDETLSTRLQNISQQIFAANTPSTFGSMVVVAWTAQPVAGFAVSGNRPAREDTNLLVESIPLALGKGHFVLNAGSIPGNLAGGSNEMQQGIGYGNQFAINAGEQAVFVGRLPLPAAGQGQLHLTALTIDTYAGGGASGTLNSQSGALYDWRSGRWTHVDVSNGELTVPNPVRFVNAAGVIRLQLSAGDASLSVASIDGGVAFGATGDVR